MQIVTLYGGLGNQLFQLSTALSICTGDISVDTSLMNKYAKRRCYNLDQLFKFPKNIKYRQHLVSLLRLPKLYNNSYLISDDTSYKKASQPTSFKIIDGYFQNGKTVSFSDQVRSIKPYLINRPNCMIAEKKCVIHIRGDDFFTTNSPVLNEEYYHQKIDEMKKRGVREFVITTDDRKYSEQVMKSANCHYSISKGDVVDDFYKIIQSKYKILSNSTFSIWANALNCENEIVLKDEGFHEKFKI